MKTLSSYQNFIALSRYARWIESENRRERWDETVDRYINFFENRANTFGAGKKFAEVKEELRESILNLEVMPSMRALMTAGPALEKDHIAGYNCAYVAVDDPKVFSEILFILMCLHEDTLVKTEFGNKKISKLTLDDKVATLNSDGKVSYVFPHAVMESRLGSEDKKFELVFDNGKTLTCTGEHELLTKNRGYVMAKDLTEDDDLESC